MTDTQLQSKTLSPSLKNFDEINEYFQDKYGLSLFMQEEPYLMDGKKPQYWVGLISTEFALLKANGDFTTKYPKKVNMKNNAGHRCITLNTLRRNIQRNRPLFMRP
ncbi:hypothetical protein [Cyanophage S-TIM54]|nr:hypothetical protein [Cyanophage S-TIM54]